jgi:hypothetical protein
MRLATVGAWNVGILGRQVGATDKIPLSENKYMYIQYKNKSIK